ncbi:hypothetical protein OPQ81_008989 [Rhizoctonia solani]|nr:hypothetical protein OPQ81_008989 [Rhizoctonia solani]
MLRSIFVLRRSYISVDPYRQFTSGNVFEPKCSKLATFYYGTSIRNFSTSLINQNPTLNLVLRKAKDEPKTAGKEATNSDAKKSGHPGALSDAKSSAKEVALNNPDSSEITQTIDEAKIMRLRKYISRFFAKYTEFKYDPTKPYTEEFLRMVKQFRWEKYSEEYKTARKRLNTASVLQFNEIFDDVSKSEPIKKEFKSRGKKEESNPNDKGKKSKSQNNKESKSADKKKESAAGGKKTPKPKNETKKKTLRKWIKLFNRIDIKGPMPKTVREFKERVKSVHTNICDVLDSDITGQKATDWENEVVLSQYTRRTEKIFPRDHPLAGTLLRHLLRHILFPSATRGFEETTAQKSS